MTQSQRQTLWKSIPIGLVVTALGAAIGYGVLTQRVSGNEKAIDGIKIDVKQNTTDIRTLEKDSATTKGYMESIDKSLTELKSEIKRIRK